MEGVPDLMPVAVYRRRGEIAVEERAVPTPGPGQVLVEVGHCGICGSDVHLMVDGWGKPGMIGGHEWTGTIAALGDGVSGWDVGEAVVGGPAPRCGQCRGCRSGQPSQCSRRERRVEESIQDGAFARYVLAPARGLLRVPAGLSRRDAALAEPLAVALHGITRSGAAPGDDVMVFGAGPIGALTIAALVARDIGPLTVVEPNERRRRLAAALGAARVVAPDELVKFPPWEPDRMVDDPVDVVLECSGKKAAIEAGFHQLRQGGTLVMVGSGIEGPAFDPNRMILNELTVRGSFVYDLGGFEQALELLASGRIPTATLVDPDDVSLDGVADALNGLAEGRIAGKVMVVPA